MEEEKIRKITVTGEIDLSTLALSRPRKRSKNEKLRRKALIEKRSKGGRPRIQFNEIIDEKYLQLLIKAGKKCHISGGKRTVQFFLAAKEAGIPIDKMPYSLAKNILPDIGAESGYNRYVRKWMNHKEYNGTNVTQMESYKDRMFNLFLAEFKKYEIDKNFSVEVEK